FAHGSFPGTEQGRWFDTTPDEVPFASYRVASYANIVTVWPPVVNVTSLSSVVRSAAEISSSTLPSQSSSRPLQVSGCGVFMAPLHLRAPVPSQTHAPVPAHGPVPTWQGLPMSYASSIRPSQSLS